MILGENKNRYEIGLWNKLPADLHLKQKPFKFSKEAEKDLKELIADGDCFFFSQNNKNSSQKI